MILGNKLFKFIFMFFRVYPYIFLLGFCILTNVGFGIPPNLDSPPQGWKVSTRSILMTTSPAKLKISQYNDITNYYLGEGKIYRTIFILPGHVPSDPEVVQLDSKRTQELERAISNVVKNYKEILRNLPRPPNLNTGATSYSKIEFVFRGLGLKEGKIGLNASKRDEGGSEKNSGLKDLYVIEDILRTSVQ